MKSAFNRPKVFKARGGYWRMVIDFKNREPITAAYPTWEQAMDTANTVARWLRPPNGGVL